tara:strand:- start:1182 stop:1442 length:261 start_codon:yes stop_codon:yes gene_type:complete
MQITEELIREIVTEVVSRIESMRMSEVTSFESAAPRVKFYSKVLTGSDVEYHFREGTEVLMLSRKTVITPLAHERCRDLKIELVFE